MSEPTAEIVKTPKAEMRDIFNLTPIQERELKSLLAKSKGVAQLWIHTHTEGAVPQGLPNDVANPIRRDTDD